MKALYSDRRLSYQKKKKACYFKKEIEKIEFHKFFILKLNI